MRKRTWLAMIGTIALSSCNKAAPPDTVDFLVANPDRLKEVMQRCREDHAKVGDAECNAASEAYRQRFMGNGLGQPKP